MTLKQVIEILNTCKFDHEDDRRYWLQKLAELKAKEDRAQENEKYFRKMAKYDR